MIAYFKGGALDGKARQNVAKKTQSIQVPMSDGTSQWYRKSGKTVYVRSGKESVPAKVFRYSNTTEKKEEKSA